MALVLAIEPDHRQASILKRVVREKIRAQLVLVDTRDAAISAIDAQIPDVILVTALLSPRDEEELVAHLRGLAGAEHLQTHTIPQLASEPLDSDGGGGGLFGKFRRKKDSDPIPGCDPDLFAEEIRTFLERASQLKAETLVALHSRVAELESQRAAAPDVRTASRVAHGAQDSAAQAADSDPVPASSWSSPFEWRRTEPAVASNAQSAPHAPAPQPVVARPLVENVPLAVIAEEELQRAEQEAERRRQEAAAEAALEQERERQRQEQEARAARERQEREEAERQRKEAEARAAREREEAERKRKEAEARAARERQEREEAERRRKEAEAKAAREREEAERKRKEAEARAAREREEAERKRKEAEAKAARERREREEAERKRLEAEAKAARERKEREEAERKRKEAEAKAAREREEAERRRLEAEAKAARERKEREEAERKRKEAEARAARERQEREEAERRRREAEARAERERQEREEAERRRLEAEAKAERERQEREAAERRRLEAEAKAARERQEREEAERRRREAEAKAERERQEREEAERQRIAAEERAAREKAEAERAAAARRVKRKVAAVAKQYGHTSLVTPLTSPPSGDDAYAEFREGYDESRVGVLRLAPLAVWARTERVVPATPQEPTSKDELREIMSRLALPPHVAGVHYPRGCRIRRVRVPAAPAQAGGGDHKQPLIVSRRALNDSRGSG
jgi:hypothetical protein